MSHRSIFTTLVVVSQKKVRLSNHITDILDCNQRFKTEARQNQSSKFPQKS